MPRRPAPHRGIDTERVEHDGPSRSELKRQSAAAQDLGKQLAELPPDRLAAMPMDDALREAILVWQRTRSHEGRRRQLQYVGKLMRQADTVALREALAELRLGSAEHTLRLHQAEHWRDQLIADDAALTRWLDEHPDSDAQQLRSLVRAARRDGAALTPEQRQPRSFRDLFQFIRPHLDGPAP